MINILLRAEDIDKSQWAHLAETSKVSSFFQTPECYSFYNSLSFMQAFVFGVSEDEQLKGVMVGFIQADGGKIKQYLSRRAIVNGGLLLADNISDEAVGQLLHTAQKELKKRAIYIETRNFNDYSQWKEVFKRNGFEYVPHLNFHNDITSIDIINNNLGKSRKRDVKKAEKNGNVIIEHPNNIQLQEYYDILKKMYKEKVHTPLFPFEFFEKLLAIDHSIILLISDGEMITEGVVCVCDNHVMYEWFACGVGSHTFATYSVMQYASKNSKRRYDMMGAGKPNEVYGVRDYKSQFGGKLVEHGRFQYICNPICYCIGKIGVKVLKKM